MADAQLSVTLSADIANWRDNLRNAATELRSTGAMAETASRNIVASISAINALNTTGLQSGLNSGAQAANNLDSTVLTVSTNISRNIAAFDKEPIDKFAQSIRDAGNTSQAASVQISVLSTVVSQNVSAFNSVNVSNFASALNQSAASLRALGESGIAASVDVSRSLSVTDQSVNNTGRNISVISTTISRNIASVNNLNLSTFISNLNAGNVGLSGMVNEGQRFAQSAAQLQSELNRLGTSLANATNPNTIRRLNAEISTTQQRLGQINRFATTGVLTPVVAGADKAAFALTNLGRVAQDAPFGFIGIQNNLNPLLESFQRLRAETGSNALAFKALGSSLLGPAGIGIALSVVSSAILFYQQYQQRANKETTAAANSLKNAKKTAEEYANTLNVISNSRLTGAINAQKEITSLKVLYSITQDTTVSSRQRGQAVDELQKKYPEYFKNIKDEIFLAGGASDAYDRLSNSIIATARAKAAEDLITKNTSRELENLQKITDARITYSKANEKLIALDKKRDALGADAGTGAFSGVTSTITKQRNKAAQDLIDSAKILREAKVDNNKLDQKNLQLVKEINLQVLNGADLAGKVGDLPKEQREKKVKTLTDVLKTLQINLKQTGTEGNLTLDERASKNIKDYTRAIDSLIKIGFSPLSEEIQKLKIAQNGIFNENVKRKSDNFFNSVLPVRLAEKARTDIEATKKRLNESIPQIDALYEQLTKPDAFKKMQQVSFVDNFGLSSTSIEINNIKNSIELLNKSFDNGSVSLDGFKTKFTELSNSLKLQNLKESLNKLAEDGISGGISNISNSIGTALVEGGSIIEAAGKGLLASFGGFLSEYGRLLIAYGAAAIIKSKLDAASLIPGAGIITGPLAIAAGIALQVAGAAVGAFASGRSSSGSSDSKSSVKQIPQFAAGVTNFSGGMALVGERGPELVNLPTGSSVIPNNRSMGIMSRAAGDQVIINGDFEIGLDKLYVRLQQAGKKLGRLG